MPANTVEEVGRLFVQYMREGNIESILELYDPEIAFVNQKGEIKRGHSELREELREFVETKQVFEFSVEKIVVNGDIALAHNHWKMVSPKTMSGYAIEVMRRQPDGRWCYFIGDPFAIKPE